MRRTFLNHYRIQIAWLLTALLVLITLTAGASTHPEPQEPLLKSAYSEAEFLRYDISWLGAIKAGKLIMRIEPLSAEEERYRIQVTAKSAGLLKFFYPVEDRFEIIVEGEERLPVRMTMLQDEGRRQGTRLTVYNQQDREVVYTKNDRPPVTFPVSGPVHNEFSSFLILRALPLTVGETLVVPTFADKKRHEVPVLVKKEEPCESLWGEVPTIKVEPQLSFQGLYEKMGNPDIWLTADQHRIPVRIKAEIKIGSLTAELKEYRREVKLASR